MSSDSPRPGQRSGTAPRARGRRRRWHRPRGRVERDPGRFQSGPIRATELSVIRSGDHITGDVTMTTTRIARRTAGPRPTSRPHVWRQPRQRRGYRRPRADTRRRLPKGVLTFWTRARRLFWSWWPWAIVSIWAIGDARWGWAIGAGAMAIVSYLIAPRRRPLGSVSITRCRSNLPSSSRRSPAPSGSPFLEGNRLEMLNNGDAFYPADARGHQEQPNGQSQSRRTSTGLAKSVASSPKRSPNEPEAGCPVKILLDADRFGEHWSGDSRQARSGGMSDRLVQPDPLVHARPVQQPHPPQVIDRGWPGRLHWRRRHCRPLAWQCPGTRRMARHADSSRGSGRCRRCRPGLRTTGNRPRASSSPERRTIRSSARAARWPCRRFSARRRLVHRACAQCTTYRSCALASRSTSPIRTSFRIPWRSRH